jgi:hypothetical protein
MAINEEKIKRFWKKVDIKGDNDCWEWKGAVQSKGYGSFGIGPGQTALAHRVAYEITSGKPIFVLMIFSFVVMLTPLSIFYLICQECQIKF